MGMKVKREHPPPHEDPATVRAWVREHLTTIYRKAAQLTKDKDRRERIKKLLKELAVEMNQVRKVGETCVQLFTG